MIVWGTLATIAASAALALGAAVPASTGGATSGSATEAPPGVTPAGDTVVWAVGDACRPVHQPVSCAPVGALIDRDAQADAFLLLGDGQYHDGSLSEYRTWYDPRMGAGRGLKAITLPAVGNHEYRTPNAAGYFQYFGARAGNPQQGWHSKTFGNWRIIAANTMCPNVGGCGPTSPQGVYLRGQLRAPEKCELVFAHHPAFTDGARGDPASGRALFSITHGNGGDLYLAGHDHNYQRFPAMRPDGTRAATGIPSLVVGTGGAELAGFAAVPPRSVYRQSTQVGAVRLVLGANGWSGRFVNVNGATMDTFSGTCR